LRSEKFSEFFTIEFLPIGPPPFKESCTDLSLAEKEHLFEMALRQRSLSLIN